MYASVGKSLAEFHMVFGCKRNVTFKRDTIEDVELLVLRKELVDLVVVCVGMADTYGWDFDNAFERVHQSNMSKLDDEGKPIYREDGKVIKSKNYKEPYLDDLV